MGRVPKDVLHELGAPESAVCEQLGESQTAVFFRYSLRTPASKLPWVLPCLSMAFHETRERARD